MNQNTTSYILDFTIPQGPTFTYPNFYKVIYS